MTEKALSLKTLNVMSKLAKDARRHDSPDIKELLSKEEIEDIFDKIIDMDDIIKNHSITIKNRYTDDHIILLQLKAIYNDNLLEEENERLSYLSRNILDKHNAAESLTKTTYKIIRELQALHGARIYYFGRGKSFTLYFPVEKKSKIELSYSEKLEFVEGFIQNFFYDDEVTCNITIDYIANLLSDTENDDYKQYVLLQDFERFARDNSEYLINDTLDKMVSILETLKNQKVQHENSCR